MASQLVLVRHGETEWSRDGRHTGRTDLPLTAEGERQASLVTETLSEWSFGAVYASPMLRARETARLAGYSAETHQALLEWDYGQIEGRRNDEITAEQPGWSKWQDAVPGGEHVVDVGARADLFLGQTAETEHDVLVFAHGHILSIMIARWLGLPPSDGRLFPLSTATVSVLTTKRSEAVLERLNHRGGHHIDAAVSNVGRMIG